MTLRVHFVNTGPDFPYAYYLGVMSAVRAFGDKVKLWLVERPVTGYLPLLEGKVEIVDYPYKLPPLLMLEGHTDHFRRVTIFDNCAWRIVAEHGGSIMGLDSFTLEPFHDLLELGKEMLVGLDDPAGVNVDTGWPFCMHGATCHAGSKIAEGIYVDSARALRGECPDGRHRAIVDGRLKFGGAGIIPFLNRTLRNLDRLSVAEFGQLGGWERGEPLPEFYIWREDGELLHPDCRTIPFYATSRKETFSEITEETVNDGDTLLSQLVEDTLDKEERRPAHKPPRKRHRFHLLGLVHLPTSETFAACAFTQKIVKLSKMLLSLDHEVILYGAEGSSAPCTEFVQTHTLADIRREWGDGDNRPECDGLGYQWRKTGFRHDFNAERTATTMKYYNNCIGAINERKRPDDFLLVMQGVYQKPIADAVKLWLTCEPGIGYRGSFARFCAFESAYLQNFTYGSRNPGKGVNGDYYDRVIPNYFDAKDFPFCAEKSDYYLFIGRLITRKGVWTAIKATEAIGATLVLAGQESDEIDVSKLPDHCEFVGYVEPEERAQLMGRARAVFVPTLYLEAFGGVNVEAQLCGTPVITTNFGCFESSVLDGQTGFRCNTLQDFVDAARRVDELDPHVIREHAERYLMRNVKWEFQRWFDDLFALWESAHIPDKLGWHRLREV